MPNIERIETVARILLGLALAWNIFLFQGQQDMRQEFQDYKLYVAENYTGKADLKNMFDAFENRFNEKLEILVSLAKK